MAALASPPPTAVPTVLYVDDCESNRLVTRHALLAAGYHVEVADSAAAALARLRLGGVDLLITDQRMPDTTGVALLRRAREEVPGVARMVVTAYEDDDAREEAERDGLASRWLTKPWSPEEIVGAVAAVLDPVACACGGGQELLPVDGLEAAERACRAIGGDE